MDWIKLLQKRRYNYSSFQPHYADIKTVLDWFYVTNLITKESNILTKPLPKI